MTDELKWRVTHLEESHEEQGEQISVLHTKIDGVVDILKRVQYMGMGIGFYFVIDSLGFVEVVKMALKAGGAK